MLPHFLQQFRSGCHLSKVLLLAHWNITTPVFFHQKASDYPHPMQLPDVPLQPLYSTDCGINSKCLFQNRLFLRYQSKNCLEWLHDHHLQDQFHSKVSVPRYSQILSRQIPLPHNHTDKYYKWNHVLQVPNEQQMYHKMSDDIFHPNWNCYSDFYTVHGCLLQKLFPTQ